jgi:hypothetical protein
LKVLPFPVSAPAGDLFNALAWRIAASMKARCGNQTSASLFDVVRTVGLGLPGVEAATKYDGSPMLKVGGSFMAGLATHRSAEPGTLVVRYDLEARASLLEEAPETYYVTDYYQPYPVVLVRLSRINRDALRDLLSVSRRLTLPKARRSPAKAGHDVRHGAEKRF